MLKHYVLSERKFGNKNEKMTCVRTEEGMIQVEISATDNVVVSRFILRYNTLSVDSSSDIGHFTLQYDAKHAMKRR